MTYDPLDHYFQYKLPADEDKVGKVCLKWITLMVAVAGSASAQSLSPVRYETGSPSLQDVWVDPVNGADTNSGASRALALRTVTAAWGRIPARQTLTTGFRIQLTAGTYPTTSVPNYWESRWGTALAPIFVEAADGVGTASLPSLNIFDCRYLYLVGLKSTAGGGDVVHCENCDHFLLRQVQIIGTGNIQASASPQETLKINQSKYVYIEDSDISGAYDNAVDMVGVQYGHVVFSKIHRSVDWCMYLKGGSAQFRVEGNEFYDCGTGGFTAGQGTGFEFMSAPWLQYEAYDVKFFNNVIHDTEGAGFGVNGGYNILLANNTLYRVGSRSHGMEFVFGSHSCDGDAQGCSANRTAGGWGPAAPGGEEFIGNRNVFVYNNLLLNPAGTRSQWQHFAVYGPRTQPGAAAPSPARTDTNLQIRGNVIWNGPADLSLGVGDGEGCLPSNPTCNATQLVGENAINTLQPSITADYKPAAVSGLDAARTFSIPGFPGGDQPSGVPAGNLDNTIPRDRDGRARSRTFPGAYETAASITPQNTVSPLAASPSALRFLYIPGGSTPAAQSVNLSAVAATAYTAALTPSGGWLSASPSASSAPITLQVSVNPAGLSAGTYQGSIALNTTGASPLTLPVTLVVFTPGSASQVFNDVPISHPWLDYIFLLGRFGVTLGCSASSPMYCPGDNVTQAQMAAFVIRALLGEEFPYPSTPYFSDMATGNPLFKYVQKMRELNINPGCGSGQFCPNSFVTRGQMAQYIVRAKYGESFSYPTTARFTDVPSGSPFFSYVQKAWDMGVTQGCTSATYCPGANVNREQMAAFLTRSFFGYGALVPSQPPVTPPPVETPPAPNPTAPQLGGCNVFPWDNVWNTPIDTLPVHTSSSTWVSTIGSSRAVKADFGSGLWDGGPIGIPFVIVPQGQARVGITFEFDEDSDAGPYPIPPNPPIEGGNASDGDRHILILEQGVCKLWEIYNAYPQGGGTWTAGSGAVFDLKVNGPLRPATYTSADAAGLPILPGLVRYDEVAGGEIKHAIRFTAPQTKKEYLWPARHQASNLTGAQYPPMGARFRLKAGVDISGFSEQVKVILRAMKKYGILLADNGSSWFLSGVPDERWDNDMLREFGRLNGSNFEAVDESSLIININSGQARQP